MNLKNELKELKNEWKDESMNQLMNENKIKIKIEESKFQEP